MLRRIFASFFAFIFFVFSVNFISTVVILDTVISPNFVSGEFVDAAYDLVYYEIAHNEEVLASLGDLSTENASQIFDGVFKSDDIQFMIDDLIGQFQTVQSTDGLLTYRLNLGFFPGGPEMLATNLASHYYTDLPKCEAMGEFTVYAVDNLAEMQCVPEQLAEEDFVSAIQLYLDREVFSDLADEFTFDVQIPSDTSITLADFVALSLSAIIFAGFLCVTIKRVFCLSFGIDGLLKLSKNLITLWVS